MNAHLQLYYDARETRSPEQREAEQFAALPGLIEHACKLGHAYADLFDGIDPRAVVDRQSLARLPVTRKYDLLERQKQCRERDPFGGFATSGFGIAMPRVFSSPGPLYEPEGKDIDYWRFARAMFAAGFRTGELIHNCFSYHFVPAGAMVESGARALGCTVFPGGTGQTEQQAMVMADLRPSCYTGTPGFLKIIYDKAAEAGLPRPCISKALVGGEAFMGDLRSWYAAQGIDAYQFYGTADLGLVAYETTAREGLVVDEGVIVEIVHPGTGDPVAPGEVGEVVVTTLNRLYPLIRFGTGDLSATLPGMCPTGRTGMRIKGWLGRADQSTKVRGMFVHPSQVNDIARRFPEVRKARMVVSRVDGADALLLCVEATAADTALQDALANAARQVTKLRAEVEFVPVNSLPDDGKVIEDRRRYD